ncbi:MAG: PAQR family membrane homeostasis protein TrhA [Usitatibacter sp.]
MYRGERFNGYTHLAGTLLALGGAATLITLGAMRGDPWRIVSFSVYGATLCLLYLASTIYHSTRGRAKAVFRKLDHSAIYLLIAGTYTPFALVTLRGAWGWSLFGGVWGLAVVGIVQELWLARGARLVSLVIYLLMGWMALAALSPLLDALSWSGLSWVALGGLVYTAGIVFYLYDERFRHWHGIWHLFVLGGSAIHFAAILKFVA